MGCSSSKSTTAIDERKAAAASAAAKDNSKMADKPKHEYRKLEPAQAQLGNPFVINKPCITQPSGLAGIYHTPWQRGEQREWSAERYPAPATAATAATHATCCRDRAPDLGGDRGEAAAGRAEAPGADAAETRDHTEEHPDADASSRRTGAGEGAREAKGRRATALREREKKEEKESVHTQLTLHNKQLKPIYITHTALRHDTPWFI